MQPNCLGFAMRALNAASSTLKELARSEHAKIYNTREDFERCAVDLPRLIVLGSTGCGKSTLLNIIAGNHFHWVEAKSATAWTEPLLFDSAHSVRSVTDTLAFANICWGGNKDRRCIIVDTPGCNDTRGDDINLESSRNVLRKQAADLHDKLQAMGKVTVFLVIHNDVSSNRLDTNVYTLLRMLEEKLGSQVWNNVAVAYSRCNLLGQHNAWKADIEEKKVALQQEIKLRVDTCNVHVPVLCLGGLTPPGGHDSIEADDEFEKLWSMLNMVDSIDTSNMKPFQGAAWFEFEKLIKSRDMAVTRAHVALTYNEHIVKMICMFVILWCREMLPTWLSYLALNLPFTYVDEILILLGFIWLLGPQKCWMSVTMFYDQWFGSSRQKID